GRVARLQPYASRCDGRHAEGVGPEGTPRCLSQKSPRAEKAPAKRREHHQGPSCLHRQTAQESKSQCGDTLTGLDERPIRMPKQPQDCRGCYGCTGWCTIFCVSILPSEKFPRSLWASSRGGCRCRKFSRFQWYK